MKRLRLPDKSKKPRWTPKGPFTVMINSDWRLRSDEVQYIVEQRKIAESGENVGQERWVIKAYCTTLDGAIMFFARHRVMTIPGTYDFEALEYLCKTLDTIKQECMNTLHDVMANELK